MTTQHNVGGSVPFIPAWLDDLGLDPYEFRVYCHIARRGECWESLPTMAENLKMNLRTLKRAVSALQAWGLVAREGRDGKSSILTAITDRSKVHQPHADLHPVQNCTPCKSAPSPSADMHGVPRADLHPEGISQEVNPSKVPPPISPPTTFPGGAQALEAEGEPESSIEPPPDPLAESFAAFWEGYPRQRRGNRAKAWQAYRRAILEKRGTSEEISDGLERYRGSEEVERGFAKGCAAWLNDDRWGCSYDPPRPGGNPPPRANGQQVGGYVNSIFEAIAEFEASVH